MLQQRVDQRRRPARVPSVAEYRGLAEAQADLMLVRDPEELLRLMGMDDDVPGKARDVLREYTENPLASEDEQKLFEDMANVVALRYGYDDWSDGPSEEADALLQRFAGDLDRLRDKVDMTAEAALAKVLEKRWERSFSEAKRVLGNVPDHDEVRDHAKTVFGDLGTSGLTRAVFDAHAVKLHDWVTTQLGRAGSAVEFQKRWNDPALAEMRAVLNLNPGWESVLTEFYPSSSAWISTLRTVERSPAQARQGTDALLRAESLLDLGTKPELAGALARRATILYDQAVDAVARAGQLDWEFGRSAQDEGSANQTAEELRRDFQHALSLTEPHEIETALDEFESRHMVKLLSGSLLVQQKDSASDLLAATMSRAYRGGHGDDNAVKVQLADFAAVAKAWQDDGLAESLAWSRVDKLIEDFTAVLDDPQAASVQMLLERELVENREVPAAPGGPAGRWAADEAAIAAERTNQEARLNALWEKAWRDSLLVRRQELFLGRKMFGENIGVGMARLGDDIVRDLLLAHGTAVYEWIDYYNRRYEGNPFRSGISAHFARDWDAWANLRRVAPIREKSNATDIGNSMAVPIMPSRLAGQYENALKDLENLQERDQRWLDDAKEMLDLPDPDRAGRDPRAEMVKLVRHQVRNTSGLGDISTGEIGFSAEAEAVFERERAAREFDEAEANLSGDARQRADDLRESMVQLVAYEASRVRNNPGFGRGAYGGEGLPLSFDRLWKAWYEDPRAGLGREDGDQAAWLADELRAQYHQLLLDRAFDTEDDPRLMAVYDRYGTTPDFAAAAGLLDVTTAELSAGAVSRAAELRDLMIKLIAYVEARKPRWGPALIDALRYHENNVDADEEQPLADHEKHPSGADPVVPLAESLRGHFQRLSEDGAFSTGIGPLGELYKRFGFLFGIASNEWPTFHSAESWLSDLDDYQQKQLRSAPVRELVPAEHIKNLSAAELDQLRDFARVVRKRREDMAELSEMYGRRADDRLRLATAFRNVGRWQYRLHMRSRARDFIDRDVLRKVDDSAGRIADLLAPHVERGGMKSEGDVRADLRARVFVDIEEARSSGRDDRDSWLDRGHDVLGTRDLMDGPRAEAAAMLALVVGKWAEEGESGLDSDIPRLTGVPSRGEVVGAVQDIDPRGHEAADVLAGIYAILHREARHGAAGLEGLYREVDSERSTLNSAPPLGIRHSSRMARRWDAGVFVSDLRTAVEKVAELNAADRQFLRQKGEARLEAAGLASSGRLAEIFGFWQTSYPGRTEMIKFRQDLKDTFWLFSHPFSLPWAIAQEVAIEYGRSTGALMPRLVSDLRDLGFDSARNREDNEAGSFVEDSDIDASGESVFTEVRDADAGLGGVPTPGGAVDSDSDVDMTEVDAAGEVESPEEQDAGPGGWGDVPTPGGAVDSGSDVDMIEEAAAGDADSDVDMTETAATEDFPESDSDSSEESESAEMFRRLDAQVRTAEQQLAQLEPDRGLTLRLTVISALGGRVRDLTPEMKSRYRAMYTVIAALSDRWSEGTFPRKWHETSGIRRALERSVNADGRREVRFAVPWEIASRRIGAAANAARRRFVDKWAVSFAQGSRYVEQDTPEVRQNVETAKRLLGGERPLPGPGISEAEGEFLWERMAHFVASEISSTIDLTSFGREVAEKFGTAAWDFDAVQARYGAELLEAWAWKLDVGDSAAQEAQGKAIEELRRILRERFARENPGLSDVDEALYVEDELARMGQEEWDDLPLLLARKASIESELRASANRVLLDFTRLRGTGLEELVRQFDTAARTHTDLREYLSRVEREQGRDAVQAYRHDAENSLWDRRPEWVLEAGPSRELHNRVLDDIVTFYAGGLARGDDRDVLLESLADVRGAAQELVYWTRFGQAPHLGDVDFAAFEMIERNHTVANSGAAEHLETQLQDFRAYWAADVQAGRDTLDSLPDDQRAGIYGEARLLFPVEEDTTRRFWYDTGQRQLVQLKEDDPWRQGEFRWQVGLGSEQLKELRDELSHMIISETVKLAPFFGVVAMEEAQDGYDFQRALRDEENGPSRTWSEEEQQERAAEWKKSLSVDWAWLRKGKRRLPGKEQRFVVLRDDLNRQLADAREEHRALNDSESALGRRDGDWAEHVTRRAANDALLKDIPEKIAAAQAELDAERTRLAQEEEWLAFEDSPERELPAPGDRERLNSLEAHLARRKVAIEAERESRRPLLSDIDRIRNMVLHRGSEEALNFSPVLDDLVNPRERWWWEQFYETDAASGAFPPARLGVVSAPGYEVDLVGGGLPVVAGDGLPGYSVEVPVGHEVVAGVVSDVEMVLRLLYRGRVGLFVAAAESLAGLSGGDAGRLRGHAERLLHFGAVGDGREGVVVAWERLRVGMTDLVADLFRGGEVDAVADAVARGLSGEEAAVAGVVGGERVVAPVVAGIWADLVSEGFWAPIGNELDFFAGRMRSVPPRVAGEHRVRMVRWLKPVAGLSGPELERLRPVYHSVLEALGYLSYQDQASGSERAWWFAATLPYGQAARFGRLAEVTWPEGDLAHGVLDDLFDTAITQAEAGTAAQSGDLSTRTGLAQRGELARQVLDDLDPVRRDQLGMSVDLILLRERDPVPDGGPRAEALADVRAVLITELDEHLSATNGVSGGVVMVGDPVGRLAVDLLDRFVPLDQGSEHRMRGELGPLTTINRQNYLNDVPGARVNCGPATVAGFHLLGGETREVPLRGPYPAIYLEHELAGRFERDVPLEEVVTRIFGQDPAVAPHGVFLTMGTRDQWAHPLTVYRNSGGRRVMFLDMQSGDHAFSAEVEPDGTIRYFSGRDGTTGQDHPIPRPPVPTRTWFMPTRAIGQPEPENLPSRAESAVYGIDIAGPSSSTAAQAEPGRTDPAARTAMAMAGDLPPAAPGASTRDRQRLHDELIAKLTTLITTGTHPRQAWNDPEVRHLRTEAESLRGEVAEPHYTGSQGRVMTALLQHVTERNGSARSSASGTPVDSVGIESDPVGLPVVGAGVVDEWVGRFGAVGRLMADGGVRYRAV
ncbi:hypothetical protein, partial [Amycolatopsis minnesotensis]|uniref:hypothetical protein n=1 Tax=Amycolatopsis minnesotensis TaxID=337894 RepID=UPI0031CE1D38